MFCTNCGKEIKAGSNFCENCGAAVTGQPASAPAPEPEPEQVRTPEQTGNSAGTAPKGKQGNFASGIITLAVVVGIILVIVNVGGLLFGNGKDIDAAEKKVLSLVTENYGEVPTVHGEVLKKVDNHVLVAVTFEVEMNGYTLDGSYIVDVRKKSHIAWQWSNELPVDYDFEENLDEILAIWEI